MPKYNIINTKHEFKFDTNKVVILDPRDGRFSKQKIVFELSCKHGAGEICYTKDDISPQLIHFTFTADNYNEVDVKHIEEKEILLRSGKISVLDKKYFVITRGEYDVNEKWYYHHLANEKIDYCEGNGLILKTLEGQNAYDCILYKNKNKKVIAFEIKKKK